MVFRLDQIMAVLTKPDTNFAQLAIFKIMRINKISKYAYYFKITKMMTNKNYLYEFNCVRTFFEGKISKKTCVLDTT